MAAKKAAAKKRPVDSGRKDAAGRRIRVSGDSSEQRADAPTPLGEQLDLIDTDTSGPDAGMNDHIAVQAGIDEVLENLNDALAAATTWQERQQAEQNADAMYQSVVNTPELAEAELAATRARQQELKDELAQLQKYEQMATRARDVASRDSINEQFNAAKANIREASAAATVAYQALDVAGAIRRNEPLDPERLEQFKQATQRHREAGRGFWELQNAAQRANGWEYGHPELRDPDQPGDGDSWDRPRDYSEDRQVTIALHQLATNEHRQFASDDKQRRELAESVNLIDRRGVGDYSHVPCTSCGGSRTRYNDETYTCGSCW